MEQISRWMAFDLDGTLTQHKTQLEPFNRQVLDDLRAAGYGLLMVGAGQCTRIWHQLSEYPITIIGNYGMQWAEYDESNRELRLVRDMQVPCDRESVDRRVTDLRREFGFTVFAGENVEFHPSGCVTFPILGTRAEQADKLAFDPDRTKRRAVLHRVIETFPEYTVFVGGSSSFDMAPSPYHKYYALNCFCEERGIPHECMTFVGDDYGPGGNDESVYLSDFGFVCVDDYRQLRECLIRAGIL